MPTEKLEILRLGWPVSNVWLLPHIEGGPLLIDTGYPLLWPLIQAGLKQQGLEPQDLAAVILTHGHSDHAGNAALLQERYGVPLYAHRLDAEILASGEGRPLLEESTAAVQIPALSPQFPPWRRSLQQNIERRLTALMCRIENRFPARPCHPQPLENGNEIAGLQVQWIPGHTPGSIFLYHPPSATLFSGDALLQAVPPSTFQTALSLPYPAFSADYPLALQSLSAWLNQQIEMDLDIHLLCAGHGPPRSGPLHHDLQQLLRNSTSPSP